MAAYNTKACLLNKVVEQSASTGQKITVFGVGNVGTAVAMLLLAQKVTNEICLIDINKDKVVGESQDMQHGSIFLGNPKIICSTDYSESANSRICIITAGLNPKPGESRHTVTQKNTEILKKAIPKLVKYSPATVIMMITNPVDVMSYVAWKVSGLPKTRVIGSGTSLESARFRFLLSERLGVAPSSIHAWVIGEHGASCVPVWSGVNVAGVRLLDINPNMGTCADNEKWFDMKHEINNAPYKVMKGKGYVSWGIALVAADLASAILRNVSEVRAVSTLVSGIHGIDKEVYLSLPCVLNANGVTSIVKQNLSPGEIEDLQKSANFLHEAQSGIKF